MAVKLLTLVMTSEKTRLVRYGNRRRYYDDTSENLLHCQEEKVSALW